MTPKEALKAHKNKKLKGLELYYELALHDNWELPLDSDDLTDPS